MRFMQVTEDHEQTVAMDSNLYRVSKVNGIALSALV